MLKKNAAGLVLAFVTVVGASSCDNRGPAPSGESRSGSAESAAVDHQDARYAFDEDKYTYWEADKMGEHTLEYAFESETTFNTISFEEKGRKIDEVKVEALIGGQYTEIYRQDEMGTRTAAIAPVKTKEVKVTIQAEEVGAGINLIAFENKPPVKRDKPLRVASYLVGPLKEDSPPCFDKLDVTTDVILIGYSKWNEKGDMVYSADTAALDKDISALKNAARGKNVNIWYCIGGFTADCKDKKDELLDTPEKREHLARQCLELVKTYDFEGIDIDYEYPDGEAQWENYEKFIIELKRQLQTTGKKVSCALAPWGVRFSRDGINAIDQVQTMVYDLFDEKRRHASYEKAVQAIGYFEHLGFKPEQINLGLSLYGRQMDTQPEKWPSYGSMIQKYGNEINVFTNAYNNSYFTGKSMNRDKTLLAIDNGLGGLMTWHMACDIPLADERSIYRGIQEIMDEFIQ